MDRDAALDLVRSARVARLATVTPDGDPHVVPIVFALDGDDLVTAVDHKPKRTRDLQRLENLRTNSRASVLIDHYSNDWATLWWVRIDGTARIVESGPDFDSAIETLVARYDQYRERVPQGPVIRVGIERVTSWEASVC